MVQYNIIQAFLYLIINYSIMITIILRLKNYNNQQYINHNIYISIIKEEAIAIKHENNICILSFHQGI